MIGVKNTALLGTFGLQHLNFFDFLTLFCAMGVHALISSQVSGMICGAIKDYLLKYQKSISLYHKLGSGLGGTQVDEPETNS